MVGIFVGCLYQNIRIGAAKDKDVQFVQAKLLMLYAFYYDNNDIPEDSMKTRIRPKLVSIFFINATPRVVVLDYYWNCCFLYCPRISVLSSILAKMFLNFLPMQCVYEGPVEYVRTQFSPVYFCTIFPLTAYFVEVLLVAIISIDLERHHSVVALCKRGLNALFCAHITRFWW